jgi:hypothetical protein
MNRYKDISGKKFNKLTVLEFAGKINNKRHVFWSCKCDCGNIVTVRGDSLRLGATKSCGCFRGSIKKHGMAYSLTYRSWINMKQRCSNKNNIGYSRYGGRGIKVCDRWLESFENFLEDMGKRPNGMSIDRIDNDDNYEPDNCKWSTSKEQSNNQTTNKKPHPNQKYFIATHPSKPISFLDNNQSRFAYEHGLEQTQISGCLSKNYRHVKGWTFQALGA